MDGRGITTTPFFLGTYDHNHGDENHVVNGMILQVSPRGVLDVSLEGLVPGFLGLISSIIMCIFWGAPMSRVKSPQLPNL